MKSTMADLRVAESVRGTASLWTRSMAREDAEFVIDDLDGTTLDPCPVVRLRFAIDGTYYVLDLSLGDATELRLALSSLIANAIVVGRRVPENERVRLDPTEAANIRRWVNDRGFALYHRDRHIQNAYRQEHAST